MCGIVGVLSNSLPFNKLKVRDMLNSISHRGRDDEGLVAINTKNNQLEGASSDLYLGHRRLSIIDLSSLGHQPMSTSDKKLWITYNGEIFNFVELRNKLINKGYKFISNTDTEVVLNAYREYGRDCLKMFRGFFAFCIYDFERQELFLARDRLGSKPLKYYFNEKIFSFSSEIKGLLENDYIDKALDYSSISQYLSLKYIPSPNTIYRNIKKLPAGSFLVFNIRKNSLFISKYWEPKFEPKIDISYDEAKEKTKEILKDSVNIRMISDVPVGVLLSGGVDSSSIVAALSDQPRKINTFSVGFSDSKFDERNYSRRIAKQFGTNHNEFVVEPDLNLDLERIICNFDEPFADPSIIPSYYLAKGVSRHVKVAIGGDGADEIFSGYKRYNIHKRSSFTNYLPDWHKKTNLAILKRMPVKLDKKKGLGRFSRLTESMSGDLIGSYYLRFSGFSKHHKVALFNEVRQLKESIWNDEIKQYFKKYNTISNLDRMLAIDQITHLPEYILTKSDISGMSNGLEIRAPFIDVELVEWANKLQSSFKNGIYSKKILKDILFEQGVPEDIVFRKKAGFTPPLRKWLASSDHLIRHYLLSESSTLNFLNPSFLKRLYDFNIKTNYSMSNQVFVLLSLGIWLEHN
tara:strand:- start:27 stop:1922 length:1896 start_codon:yes stop_codon:yes gene_type:complete